MEFHFGQDFQLKVLALMRKNFEFLAIAQEMIQPEYFSTEILSWYFKTIRNYYIDYKLPISDLVLKNELAKAAYKRIFRQDEFQSCAQVYHEISKPVADADYISSEVTTFCRHQAIKAAILDLPPYLQKGDFHAVENILREALLVGTGVDYLGVEYFSDWYTRIKNKDVYMKAKALPTGIRELDSYIGGGLKPRQLGIWMGPPNRGKSLALVQCTKRAIVAKLKVIYYTLELSEDDVAERFDSSFSKIPVKELMDREAALVERLENCGILWGNSLIIREYPAGKATSSTLRGHILQCQNKGFFPDAIMVDYLDLLRPTRRRREKREEYSDITTELRGLAGEFRLPLWSATQSNRSAISMETHTEEQVSEDIGKIAIADIAVTINQKVQEVQEQKMRLFLAKNRNGPKYITIPIQGNTYRMCFYDPELS